MKRSITYLSLITYFVVIVMSSRECAASSHLNFLYNNRFGSFVRPTITGKWFSSLSGWYCDRWFSKFHISSFVRAHRIDMSEAVKPLGDYSSFNEFFIRKLKKEARPIDHDSRSITSPCDGYIITYQNITNAIQFPIKGVPFNLASCLNNKSLAEKYKGGTLVMIRLAPHNYHWFHAPITGIPTPSKRIQGKYESVNPTVYGKGVQPLVTNERQFFIFKTKNYDDILMIPVGALCVGKIITTYTPFKCTRKGSELGYFKFGGSTMVMIFKKGIIELDKTIVHRSRHNVETEIKMGQKIGAGKPKC